MAQSYTLTKNHGMRADVKANLHDFIDRLPETKSWKVEIKEARNERSSEQNAALFGLAYVVLSEATGFTADELHEAFCCRFFGTVEKEVMGRIISKPWRTTTTNEDGQRDVMPAHDFARFYDAVQQIGAEAGVDVPDPDPLHAQRDRFAAQQEEMP